MLRLKLQKTFLDPLEFVAHTARRRPVRVSLSRSLRLGVFKKFLSLNPWGLGPSVRVSPFVLISFGPPPTPLPSLRRPQTPGSPIVLTGTRSCTPLHLSPIPQGPLVSDPTGTRPALVAPLWRWDEVDQDVNGVPDNGEDGGSRTLT